MRVCCLLINLPHHRTVSLILDNLSSISQDIGAELDSQNAMIAEMIRQSAKVEHGLQTVNSISRNLY